MSNNILPRICKSCGCTFDGGPRAWYCPGCRVDRRKAQLKEHRMRRREPRYNPIGSVIKCELCGKEIIKNSGRQRYCPQCAEKHLKEVDNLQSLEWKRNNPEKIREGKRLYSKRRHAEEGKQSGIKYISWEKSHKKWKVIPYVNGKQVRIGEYSSLDDAKSALIKFLNTMDDPS
ncbi:MAG: hypothetical protein Q4D16_19515 [Eubacteriales bacterium]|nr:hypothetical protein [Eubacteriales bacterium]